MTDQTRIVIIGAVFDFGWIVAATDRTVTAQSRVPQGSTQPLIPSLVTNLRAGTYWTIEVACGPRPIAARLALATG